MFVRFKGTIVNKLRIVHFKNKELYKDFLDKYYDKQFSYAANGTTYKQALNFYNSYGSNFCVWINKYDKQRCRCSLSFGSLPYARMNYSSTNIEEYTIDNNNKLEIE